MIKTKIFYLPYILYTFVIKWKCEQKDIREKYRNLHKFDHFNKKIIFQYQ